MLACDFLTVETAFLQRIYVLFFISLATRRIEYLACTATPDGDWVAQQAPNLTMELGEEHRFRYLIHDRDAKFSHAFDEVRSEGLKVIPTPGRAPNANAPAERWVRTARTDCLRPDPHPWPSAPWSTCSAPTAATTTRTSTRPPEITNPSGSFPGALARRRLMRRTRRLHARPVSTGPAGIGTFTAAPSPARLSASEAAALRASRPTDHRGTARFLPGDEFNVVDGRAFQKAELSPRTRP